ncbi:MAG: hypothetical protein LBT81_06125 [Helicobacteraceae bacterium]|jgi:polyphosphate kinase 2 (PPK2 family)|nr:hypothetical protein [Helicobacteraceae bacterium]
MLRSLSKTRRSEEPKLAKEPYIKALKPLREELGKMLGWVTAGGRRLIVLVCGRAASGKGGLIRAISEQLDTKYVKTYGAPISEESREWYFAQFASKLPKKGEMALFDEGWYERAASMMNRAGDEEYARFTLSAVQFEQLLSNEGFLVYKFFLTITKEEQSLRLAAQKRDRVAKWRLEESDLKAVRLYGEWTKADLEMLSLTHTPYSPWYVADANDKRRMKLGVIAHLLDRLDYKGKEEARLLYDSRIVTTFTQTVKF